MELVGFIIEHDNIKKAIPFERIKGDIPNDTDTISKVIDYLNKGTLILSWMGYSMDIEDGSLIAPDGYYTDGIFVWPVYFPYYLNKYHNYKINEEFLKHLMAKDFHQQKIDISVIENMEVEFLKELKDKNPDSSDLP